MIVINDEYRAQFLASYMEAAEWSSTHTEDPDGSNGVPIDSLNLSWDEKSEAQAKETCNSFIDANMADLILADEKRKGARPDSNGHDLWLTAAGHGAGFWDRGLGEVGTRLSKASKPYTADLYVGDDRKIHLT